MRVRWSNVNLIARREIRDQMRDKRTLFMIFVLPILLYPVLGFSVSQFSAAFEKKPRAILLVGPEFLPDVPPLLNTARDGFAPQLFDNPNEAQRLTVKVVPGAGIWLDSKFREPVTRRGEFAAIVIIPPDLRKQIAAKKDPLIAVEFDSADERSQIAYFRLKEVLAHWRENLVSLRLKQDELPENYTEPVKIKPVDVATAEEVGSSVWAKIFPFLLVMMSLTGAFYPAIDLCAGEKERGTMETLLISPASRAEIVLGKFFTVFLASVLTALLNLLSMGLTGMQIARNLASGGAATATTATHRVALIAAPSLTTALWIVILLIPLAAFFSAVCLALAVLAKSMKEGQYYMTPLYVITLPLIFLTLAPEIEINLFYSLVPVTGVSLLLRSLIQGDYDVAWKFFLPVLIPTVCYGALALRWAIDQFQREDVLFREAERLDLRIWFRHLLRDKEPLPTGGEALFCFVLMLALAWFMIQYIAVLGFASSTAGLAAGQVAFILTPPLAMALVLTSSPRRTLRLYWPSGKYLAIGAGLALSLNPIVNELRPIVERLFPMSEELKHTLEQLVKHVPNLPTALLLFAVIPAVCEEVAFRGYILSGLERGHTRWAAIVMSAVLFGFMHVLMSLFQQLFNATLLGLVLGLLAIRSRSLLPGIVFHLLNNGIALLTPTLVTLTGATAQPGSPRLVSWLYRDAANGRYHVWIVLLGVLVSLWLLSRLINHGMAVENKPVLADAEFAST